MVEGEGRKAQPEIGLFQDLRRQALRASADHRNLPNLRKELSEPGGQFFGAETPAPLIQYHEVSPFREVLFEHAGFLAEATFRGPSNLYFRKKGLKVQERLKPFGVKAQAFLDEDVPQRARSQKKETNRKTHGIKLSGMGAKEKTLLSKIPAVHQLAEDLAQRYPGHPEVFYIRAARETAERLRREILQDGRDSLALEEIQRLAEEILSEVLRPHLRRVINATGVVVHTNLGRSPLAEEALEEILSVARGYSNLEYRLAEGRRGSRYEHVTGLLRELTGAEEALVVNNNAAAVLITLNTLARGREVIVSRGELVEIGGSFRMPEVMAWAGCVLREVGTTNRTHLRDYEAAINENTALLMKVHKSNYAIVGFTREVSGAELVALGHRYGIPVVEDLGSGCLVDFARYGLRREPTVQEIVRTGVDVVTFSGDKLLGGPQAGIIVGRRELVEKIRQNPLNRALRIDKLTLAGLEATLRLYLDERLAVEKIPTLRMIMKSPETVKREAHRLKRLLSRAGLPGFSFAVVPTVCRTGGGALPVADLPSYAVAVISERFSPEELHERLRVGEPPVVGRIEEDRFLLEVRTVFPEEFPLVVKALRNLVSHA